MLEQIGKLLTVIDDFLWNVPLIVLILFAGIFLTIRLRGIQFSKLGKAMKYMFRNEEGGDGEVTSFAALCTALSATIGTGNIVGVATALVAGGPGALFWMWIAALFGMATKYAEGVLAVKYRVVAEDGHGAGRPLLLHTERNGNEVEMAGEALRVFRRLRGPVRNRHVYPGKRNYLRSEKLF